MASSAAATPGILRAASDMLIGSTSLWVTPSALPGPRPDRNGCSMARADSIAPVLPHRGYAQGRIAQAAARLRERVHAERVPIAGLELDSRPARMGEPLGPLFATH